MSDEKSLKTIATVVYALQAVGFFVGITWLVAIVIGYVKRDDARGTWLESHFNWQIRTFWWGLLWGIVGDSAAGSGGLLRAARDRGVAHLPHRQGLAQPRREQASAFYRGNLISSG
jgi:hypothetical protein